MQTESQEDRAPGALSLSVMHLGKMRSAFPAHFHACYVFGFVAGGKSTMGCREQSHELESGSALILNPGQIHQCLLGGPLDYFSVHVPVPVMQYIECALGRRGRLPYFSGPTLPKGVSECLAEAVMPDCSDDVRSARFLQFLRMIWPEQSDDALPVPERTSVSLAREIMRTEYAQPLSLPRIAERCAVSESTLLRSFLRLEGVSPHAYLLSLRVEHARELLLDGCAPSEAALRAGFCDQSHLTNVFRRYIGMTPRAYQKTHAAVQRLPRTGHGF